jgi:hypothetical protein
MPETLNSCIGRNKKRVFILFLLFLGAAMLTSGCAHVENTKDTQLTSSPTVSGSTSTIGNSPVNDTVIDVHDYLLPTKSYDTGQTCSRCLR